MTSQSWMPDFSRQIQPEDVKAQDWDKEAKQALESGDYKQAIYAYDKAITHSPSNHVNYFRRSTTYYIIGKIDQAIADLDKVLGIREVAGARLKRGRMLLSRGDVHDAIIDLDIYLQSHGDDTDVKTNIENARSVIELLKVPGCRVDDLDTILQISPRFISVLVRRGDCFVQSGQTDQAVGDYSKLVKLQPNDNSLYLKLSSLYLSLGEIESSLTYIKECLHNDPDHKECKIEFKKIKPIQKQFIKLDKMRLQKQWLDISKTITPTFIATINALNSKNLRLRSAFLLCQSHHGMKQHEVAIEQCTKVLEIDDSNFEARLDRAESLLATLEFERALLDFKKCYDQDRNNERVQTGHQQSAALLKRSKSNDYYKTLGVDRLASAKDIKRGYRRQASEWHPDKYNGNATKDEVMVKMSAINQAYEVLRSEELKERYDRGDDPNDLSSNGGGGGGQQNHAFHNFQGFGGGGGFPQGFPGQGGGGGGGFQFKFQ